MQIAVESEDLQYLVKVTYTVSRGTQYLPCGDRVFSRIEHVIEDIRVVEVTAMLKLRRGLPATKNYFLGVPEDPAEYALCIEDAQDVVDCNYDEAARQIQDQRLLLPTI